jgi:hypothetical protein
MNIWIISTFVYYEYLHINTCVNIMYSLALFRYLGVEFFGVTM